MKANTSALIRSAVLVLSYPVVAAGGFIVGKAFDVSDDKVGTLQCVDTASQETVFYEDYILHANNEYDSWLLNMGESKISYIQPSGIVCTLRPSVMAVENATGVVD
jgi:hypothetical protein